MDLHMHWTIKCYAARMQDKNFKVNRDSYRASVLIKPQLKLVFIIR